MEEFAIYSAYESPNIIMRKHRWTDDTTAKPRNRDTGRNEPYSQICNVERAIVVECMGTLDLQVLNRGEPTLVEGNSKSQIDVSLAFASVLEDVGGAITTRTPIRILSLRGK